MFSININKIFSSIEGRLSKKRLQHSVNVSKVAKELSKVYMVDVVKTEIASLLHDIAKEYKGEELLDFCKRYNLGVDDVSVKQPSLLHAKVSYYIAKTQYRINDIDILNSIKYHTTGRENMSNLEKIIYISDMIEESRVFDGVDDIRVESRKNLNNAVLLGLESTMKFIINKGYLLHLDTVKAWNFILNEIDK